MCLSFFSEGSASLHSFLLLLISLYLIIIPFHLPQLINGKIVANARDSYVCTAFYFFVHACVVSLIGKTSAYSNSKDHIYVECKNVNDVAFFFPEQVLPLIGNTSAYSNSKDQPSFEVHACVSKGS